MIWKYLDRSSQKQMRVINLKPTWEYPGTEVQFYSLNFDLQFTLHVAQTYEVVGFTEGSFLSFFSFEFIFCYSPTQLLCTISILESLHRQFLPSPLFQPKVLLMRFARPQANIFLTALFRQISSQPRVYCSSILNDAEIQI